MTISGGKSAPIWTGGSVLVILLAILIPSVLLDEGESGAPRIQLRDSAGAKIVESLRPSWEEGAGWRVGSQPLLRLGVVEGDPAQQFSGITGLARLDDGTVVVADDASQEVRFFGPGGEVKTVVGGRGGGPGEFTGLAGLGLDPSGGVWAYDFSLRRVTWISPEGIITRLTTLAPEPPTLNALGALSDGSFVLKQLWGYAALAEARQPGLRRDPVAVVRFDPTGILLDTLGLFAGREVYLFEENGRGVMSTPPFARNATGAVHQDRIVVGTQEDFSVRELDPQGVLRRIIRIPGQLQPAGSAELETYIQGRLAGAPSDQHPSIRQSLEEMPHPETLPAYGGILVDRLGNLWASHWAMAPEVPSFWTTFDVDGGWLGRVRVPTGFYPWDVGEDWILGTERDELDVEYVVLYPLHRE